MQVDPSPFGGWDFLSRVIGAKSHEQRVDICERVADEGQVYKIGFILSLQFFKLFLLLSVRWRVVKPFHIGRALFAGRGRRL